MLTALVVYAVAAFPAAAASSCRLPLKPAVRTDFFFGIGGVGVDAWSRFLAKIVTPRFRNGLSVSDAEGQWRGSNAIVHEKTRVLVIYRRDDRASADRIEAIRAIYRRRFVQTSVLRADSAVCLGFDFRVRIWRASPVRCDRARKSP